MRLFTIFALALAIGLATAASPFASSAPDGLNRVAEDQGFASAATHESNYAFPGIDNPRLSTGLAGFTGTVLVLAIGFGVVKLARRR
jgi:PDGLE domain-containing protein